MIVAIMSLCALCEIKLDGDQERKRPVGWMFLHCVLLCRFCSVSLGSPATNISVFAWENCGETNPGNRLDRLVPTNIHNHRLKYGKYIIKRMEGKFFLKHCKQAQCCLQVVRRVWTCLLLCWVLGSMQVAIMSLSPS